MSTTPERATRSKRNRAARRLRDAAMLGLVRGAATTVGAAAVTALTYWLQRQ